LIQCAGMLKKMFERKRERQTDGRRKGQTGR